jgi:hypothetical protein
LNSAFTFIELEKGWVQFTLLQPYLVKI